MLYRFYNFPAPACIDFYNFFQYPETVICFFADGYKSVVEREYTVEDLGLDYLSSNLLKIDNINFVGSDCSCADKSLKMCRFSGAVDSGNIEEIADQIILPYRIEFDDKTPKEVEDAEIIIDKGRTSGTGVIKAKFYAPIQKWTEEGETEDIRIIYPNSMTLEEELPSLPMA